MGKSKRRANNWFEVRCAAKLQIATWYAQPWETEMPFKYYVQFTPKHLSDVKIPSSIMNNSDVEWSDPREQVN
jgi:hypothetical protein